MHFPRLCKGSGFRQTVPLTPQESGQWSLMQRISKSLRRMTWRASGTTKLLLQTEQRCRRRPHASPRATLTPNTTPKSKTLQRPSPTGPEPLEAQPGLELATTATRTAMRTTKAIVPGVLGLKNNLPIGLDIRLLFRGSFGSCKMIPTKP